VIDLDGNGIRDVVVWYENMELLEIDRDEVRLVLAGQGDGGYVDAGFLDFSEVDFGDSLVRNQVAMVDFGGDGTRDLLLTQPVYGGENEVFVLERTVDPFWSVMREVEIPVDIEGVDVEVGQAVPALTDVSGDGEVDLVYPCRIRGDEDDVAGLVVFESPWSDLMGDRVRVVDLGVALDALGVGDVRFEEMRVEAAGDLDGDGTGDLVIGGNARVFEDRENEDPMLRGWRVMDPMGVNQRFSIVADFRGHARAASAIEGMYEFPHALFVDVDGDRVRDRVMVTRAESGGVGNGAGEVEIGTRLIGLLADPGASGVKTNQILTARPPTFRDAIFVRMVDLDLDGIDEVLVAREESIVAAKYAPGVGYVYCRRDPFVSEFGPGFRFELARFDSDPVPDVISRNASFGSPVPAVYLNPEVFCDTDLNRIESFDFYPMLDALDQGGIEIGVVGSSFSAGDLDGDGFDDVVHGARVRDETGAEPVDFWGVVVWLSDGNGSFTYGGAYPIEGAISDDGIALMAIMDTDFDGDLDVLIEEESGSGNRIRVLSNSGSGALALEGGSVMDDEDSDLRMYWIEVVDLDGDGFEDLVVLLNSASSMPGAHEVRIVFGGAAGLGEESLVLRGGGALETYCADIDGNGLLDVVACSNGPSGEMVYRSSVSVAFQIGARVFEDPVSIQLSEDVGAGVHAKDLDGDGSPEIIVTGALSSIGMTVLWSRGEPCAADLNLDGALDFFDIALMVSYLHESRAIADFNGDGASDLMDLTAFLAVFGDGCP